jgi:hypothetical protein
MSDNDRQPIKLHRGNDDTVLSLGNAGHPYLKLPPRYEQHNLLGVSISAETKPKVYGLTEGQEFIGREGWVSIIYAWPLSEVGLPDNEKMENEEKPYKEE